MQHIIPKPAQFVFLSNRSFAIALSQHSNACAYFFSLYKSNALQRRINGLFPTEKVRIFYK